MEAAKQKLIAPGEGLTRVSKSNQIYLSLLGTPFFYNCVKIPIVEREAPVSSPSSIELNPSQVSNLSSHQREPQEVDDTCISGDSSQCDLQSRQSE